MDQELPHQSLLGITSSPETNFSHALTAPISGLVTSKILDAFSQVAWEQFMLGQASQLFVRQYMMNFLSAQQRTLSARDCVDGVADAVKLEVRVGGANLRIVPAKNVVEQANDSVLRHGLCQ
jgi:hypothetical protein